MKYLNGEKEKQSAKYTPKIDYKYELIVAIANEGQTDAVMNAANSAGPTEATVLHGSICTAKRTKKFFNVSIAQRKRGYSHSGENPGEG